MGARPPLPFVIVYMSADSAVITSGWLYREESVQGSLTTWKKRWNVLTLQKLQCFKHHNATEPISSVSVASIEAMAYGANVSGDKNRTFAFSLTTPRGDVKLAADDEETREQWCSTLRALVPKAKVELAKEMLMRKAKRKANLELAQQQIKEAIESILRDSKRVAVRGGFKTYADALAECFLGLLDSVDLVSEMGLNSAKQCAYSISSIVDAANSAAAICTNKAIQDEVVVRTRDIAIETANLLGYATTASHDAMAQQKMFESVDSIKEQVQQMLELLAAAGALQQEMDDAKAYIEEALEAPAMGSSLPTNATVEQCMDTLNDRAKLLSTTIKNIANNACVVPERVGEFSRETAELMCELLDATNIIAVQSGVDMNDPGYLAGTSAISEHKKQQVESLLAAAKGFAAATTNMIDLLKQIPNQEDDGNLQFRLSMATRSADNALNAFMSASTGLDTTEAIKRPVAATPVTNYGVAEFDDPSYGRSSSAQVVDAEKELLLALNSIEASVSRFTLAPGVAQPVSPGGRGGRGGAGGARGGAGVASQFSTPSVPSGTDASAGMVKAAKKMCEATATLMTAAVAAQKHIKSHDDATYRNDPNWTSGVVASAKAVAETTGLLVDVACDPNSTPEDIVAAVRCVNGATARLVAFTRVKGDPNSPEQQSLEQASRAIAKAANNLVEIAKRQKQSESDANTDNELASIKNATKTRQIKLEFEAQARIAKLEVDLDAARQYLFKLRRAVYGHSPDSSSTTTVKKNPTPKSRGVARGGPPRQGPVRGAAPARGSPRGAPRGRGGPRPLPPRGGPVRGAAAPAIGSPRGAPRGRGGPRPLPR